MITAADLFSGLGGFTEGAHQTGKVAVTIAANHWADACRWHAENHPETTHLQQDLQQMDMRRLHGIDLLLAAPECQGHSQNSQPARKGTGGNGQHNLGAARERTILQRSTAWAIISAAEIARPQTIIIENVPEIMDWSLYRTWLACLGELGYSLSEQIINSANYGSCQDRNRAIITANLGEPVRLAQTWGAGRGAPIGDCLDLEDRPEHRWAEITAKSGRMQDRMRKAQGQAGSRCLWNNVSQSRGRPLDGLAPTLTTGCGSQLYLLDGDRGRILNPSELARIQGFPRGYHLPKQRGLAGKLIGNAIDVNVSRGVLEQITTAA